MTAAAWDAVRDAPSVVAASDGPHVEALRDAGIEVIIGPRPSGDSIWMQDPGDTSWAADLAEQMLIPQALGSASSREVPPAQPSPDADLAGTVLDPVTQMANHDPRQVWDPMVDYAMMSRFNRGFASLLFANKPTVAKLHGFAVAGGSDIALFADQIICADDVRIGYPPVRVWGIPAAGMWSHRIGDARAKRMLFTGDLIDGRTAVDWGLAVESWPAPELDERTEALVQRMAQMPINQLIMAKLALNSALLAQGVATSGMVSTVFDGVARHTTEGYAFQQRAAEAGFRQAVRERDEPFGDAKPV